MIRRGPAAAPASIQNACLILVPAEGNRMTIVEVLLVINMPSNSLGRKLPYDTITPPLLRVGGRVPSYYGPTPSAPSCQLPSHYADSLMPICHCLACLPSLMTAHPRLKTGHEKPTEVSYGEDTDGKGCESDGDATDILSG